MSEVVKVPTSRNGATEGLNAGVSRRSFVGSAALVGMAVAVGSATASASDISGEIQMSEEVSVKIRRARLSGPASLTKDATVAEVDAQGKMTVLFQGTNKWICLPGN